MYRAIDTSQYNAQEIFGNTEVIDSCWKWMGSMYKSGYGKIGKRGYPVHRIAYQLVKNEVPRDMCLDHLCKNRDCINPDHLEVVTLVDNVMRGDSQHAINARKTHCKNGHEFTTANTYRRRDRRTRECKTCRNGAVSKYIAKKEG